jgi:hypothetical protein
MAEIEAMATNNIWITLYMSPGWLLPVLLAISVWVTTEPLALS